MKFKISSEIKNYLDKALIGFGWAIIFISAWWLLVGANEVLQLSPAHKITSVFQWLGGLVVFLSIVSFFEDEFAPLTSILSLVCIMIPAAVALKKYNSITLAASVAFVLLFFVVVGYVLSKRIKKGEKQYWITAVFFAALFATGVFYTPKVVDYKSLTNMYNMEACLAQVRVDSSGLIAQITVPVKSEAEGYNLAQHLYFEVSFDGTSRNLFKSGIDDANVKYFSDKDTSYFHLVFSTPKATRELWLFSYDKKRK